MTTTVTTKPVLALWAVDPRSAEYATLLAWMRLRDAWLASPKGRGQVSPETRRSYAAGTALWLEWLAGLPGGPTYPWEAQPEHVRAWQAHLRTCGLSESSVNQRLAAISSWYDFAIRDRSLVAGRERSLYTDAGGQPRANPAAKLRRTQIRPYGKARPLNQEKLRQLFSWLEGQAKTAHGARNHALLLTYFLTGARASEVVRMRWGDVRESRAQRAPEPGAYVWAWTGKGGKAESTALPARAYAAIATYVRWSGRAMAPGEYIWQPVSRHGRRNLLARSGESLHISARNAARIFRNSLRMAGVDGWQLYRLHDLRHTFAHLHHQQFHDLPALRRLLHHENLATTDLYVREMSDPVDVHSEQMWSALNLG